MDSRVSQMVDLKQSGGFEWEVHNGILFRGMLLDGGTCLDNLESATSHNEVFELLNRMEGFYSIIIERDEFVYFVVDQLRSFPLFYGTEKGRLLSVTDMLSCQNAPRELDSKALEEFGAGLFVPGTSTAFEGVSQIEAGCCLVVNLDNGSFFLHTYYPIKYGQNLIEDKDTAVSSIRDMYDNIFMRLATKLQSEPNVVIPLSGGHDSRLITYYLKSCGVKNVITYSYGVENNTESVLALQVSRRLGTEHHFVDYRSRKVKEHFRRNLDAYIDFAGNGVSVACVQELGALSYLINQGCIPPNSLVVPGFGGVITGHYVHEMFIKDKPFNTDEVIRLLNQSFFGGKDIASQYVESNKTVSSIRATEIFEEFTFREEQSKFIQNACRVYEFYNLRWFTPFFTKSVLNAWFGVHPALRFSDSIYLKFERDLYAETLIDIPFTGSKEMQHFHESTEQLPRDTYFIRMVTYLRPLKLHYLWGAIPVYHYYRSLIIDKTLDVNAAIRRMYLMKLRNSTK